MGEEEKGTHVVGVMAGFPREERGQDELRRGDDDRQQRVASWGAGVRARARARPGASPRPWARGHGGGGGGKGHTVSRRKPGTLFAHQDL